MIARALVVDLAVHYEELDALPLPHYAPGITRELLETMSSDQLRLARGNWRERFVRWYTFGERLFHLAIAAGIAVELAPERPADALGALRLAVDDGYLLQELDHALDDGLDYIGHEVGYFYGGQPWHELCHYRSAVTFLHELTGLESSVESEVEAIMTRYGVEMYEELDIPKGMPARHWWWFGASPSA